VVICFVDIGRVVHHHFLEVVIGFVDIGRNIDQHCFKLFS
jgi:hypothetical protein